MSASDQRPPPTAGPFGLGRQGYIIIAVIIGGSAALAVSQRGSWTAVLLSALLPPLVLFPLIYLLTRNWQGGPNWQQGLGGGDLLTFLARTNPIMFVLFGQTMRRSNNEEYRRLLGSGPYGLGLAGYVVSLVLILSPLLIALIIMALTGRLPTHSGPHFP
jgi:hypothetical protein